jgi:hypothetical protein
MHLLAGSESATPNSKLSFSTIFNAVNEKMFKVDRFLKNTHYFIIHMSVTAKNEAKKFSMRNEAKKCFSFRFEAKNLKRNEAKTSGKIGPVFSLEQAKKYFKRNRRTLYNTDCLLNSHSERTTHQALKMWIHQKTYI